MTRLISLFSENRFNRVHLIGKLRAGENKGQFRNVQIICNKDIGYAGNIPGEFIQNALDFVGFHALQRPQLVVGFHHAYRFDESVAPEAEVSWTSPFISFLY